MRNKIEEATTMFGMIAMCLAMVAAILVLALLITSAKCRAADWSTETKVEEVAYQTVSAADTWQSLNIAHHPHDVYESYPTTSYVLGTHPSVGVTLAWGVGRGVFHLLITDALERNNAPRWLQRTWQAVTLLDESNTVRRNWTVGLHFGAPPTRCEPTTTGAC